MKECQGEEEPLSLDNCGIGLAVRATAPRTTTTKKVIPAGCCGIVVDLNMRAENPSSTIAIKWEIDQPNGFRLSRLDNIVLQKH